MVVAGNLPQARRQKSIRHVLIVVLMLDLLMALAKGGYGYFTGSIGMISDGLHSTLHAAGGIVGLAGIHLAARPADASHPYGYERYELLAAMGISVLMLAAVWGILDDAWTRFHSHEVPRITGLSFAIIVASIFLYDRTEYLGGAIRPGTLQHLAAGGRGANPQRYTRFGRGVGRPRGRAIRISDRGPDGFGARRRNHCLDSVAHCPGRFARSGGCRCRGRGTNRQSGVQRCRSKELPPGS